VTRVQAGAMLISPRRVEATFMMNQVLHMGQRSPRAAIST
jgi:hypothetical protein